MREDTIFVLAENGLVNKAIILEVAFALQNIVETVSWEEFSGGFLGPDIGGENPYNHVNRIRKNPFGRNRFEQKITYDYFVKDLYKNDDFFYEHFIEKLKEHDVDTEKYEEFYEQEKDVEKVVDRVLCDAWNNKGTKKVTKDNNKSVIQDITTLPEGEEHSANLKNSYVFSNSELRFLVEASENSGALYQLKGYAESLKEEFLGEIIFDTNARKEQDIYPYQYLYIIIEDNYVEKKTKHLLANMLEQRKKYGFPQIYLFYERLNNRVTSSVEDFFQSSAEHGVKVVPYADREVIQMDVFKKAKQQLQHKTKKIVQGTIDEREEKALELIKDEKFEEANTILESVAWKKEVDEYKTVMENAKEFIRRYISGQKTLICNLQKKKNEGIRQENYTDKLQDIYQEIVSLAYEYQISLSVLYDYACFLLDNECFSQGIIWAERLSNSYESRIDVDFVDKIKLYLLLGKLYENVRQLRKANEYYIQVLDLLREPGSEEEDNLKTEAMVRRCSILWKMSDSYEAEQFIIECLATMELQETSSISSKAKIEIYKLAGNLASRRYELEKAVEYFEKAKALYQERFALTNDAEDEFAMTIFDNNLGIIYRKLRNYTESELHYKEAIAIREKAFATNKQKYRRNLALVKSNYAMALGNKGDIIGAIKNFEESIKLKNELPNQELASVRISMANSYLSYGMFMRENKSFEDAEKMLCQAMEIFSQLSEENEASYIMHIAELKMEYAKLMIDKYENGLEIDFEEFKKYCEESLESYNYLASKNTGYHRETLRRTNMLLAKYYLYQKDFDNAKSYYDKALEYGKLLVDGCQGLKFVMQEMYEELEKLLPKNTEEYKKCKNALEQWI